MLIFIYSCILILNVVAVFLTYRFLGESLPKKERAIFVIVGMAIMYMLVTAVYYISTKNTNFPNETVAKNLITFAFVPINEIAILPMLARSYKYFKEGRLKAQKLKNRAILLVCILVVILILEFFYFKDIQTGILETVTTQSTNVVK